jgi:predicted dehydrogenase
MRTLDTREVVDVPKLGKAKVDVEDWWQALIRFKSGVTIHWTFANCLTPSAETTGVYYGRNGSLRDNGYVFHAFQGGGTITLPDKSTISREQIQIRYLMQLSPEQKARLFPYGTTDGFSIEIWDFINSVATGRQPEMDGHAGLRAKALCEACYESATAGRAVKYSDVLEGVVNAYQKPIDEFWEI